MKALSITGIGSPVYYWTNEIESRRAIVFCHGLTADHHLFDKQCDYFEDKVKFINWDWPLHGKSRPYSPFTYQHVASDLKAILDKEGVDQVVLVGQSAGGYIGQAFMEIYPEKVIGFIGIGTTPFGQNYYKKSDLFWIKHFASIARLYPYRYYCKASSQGITRTEAASESMLKTLQELGKTGMLTAAKAVYNEFLKVKDEVNITCPVLLTIGEYDQTGYVRKYNTAWSEKRGYTLVIIKEASHNANYDNHVAFNELLDDFISEHNLLG